MGYSLWDHKESDMTECACMVAGPGVISSRAQQVQDFNPLSMSVCVR